MIKKFLLFLTVLILFIGTAKSQVITDTAVAPVQTPVIDSSLRITNLNPYFTLHVDSMLSYQLAINQDEKKYYWYLKNSPIGLKINKDNGLLTFKAEKSFFLSGKLKYDVEYAVKIGVQNLSDPKDKVDTSFTLVFYNTEIIQPKLKPTVSNLVIIEEGQPFSFSLLCEDGNFPIDDILFSSSITISDYKMVKHCDDIFEWTPPFDFVKETDKDKEKAVVLTFVGSTKFKVRDTVNIRVLVKDALNYPLAKKEYDVVKDNLESYILRLKYTFVQLDRKLKKNQEYSYLF